MTNLLSSTKLLFSQAVVWTFLASCSLGQFAWPSQAEGADASLPALHEHLDLVYAEEGERKLHLDLWQPAGGPPKKPAIVVVHGGGWLQGNKAKFHPLAKALAVRGYVTAAIEYRLGGEARFPAAIHDCNAAVRWLRANAESYGIDPDRIGAVGGSAGGHLVGLMAAAPDHRELRGAAGDLNVSSRIQAVVVLAGPWQLASGPVAEKSRKEPDSNTNRWFGKTIDQAPELYRLASPLTHLSPTTPPTLFMAGELDQPERNRASRCRLRELGVRTGVQVYEKGKHGCWNREPWRTRMVLDMDAFFSAIFDRKLPEAPTVLREQHSWGTISQAANRLLLELASADSRQQVEVPRLYSSIGKVSGGSNAADESRDADRISVTPEPAHWIVHVPQEGKIIEIGTIEPFATWTLPPILSSQPGPRPMPGVAESPCRTVTLPAHAARTKGKMLRYEPQPHKNCVGYWVHTDDSCAWRFYLEDPGTFEVVVSQGCGKGQGGSRVELQQGEQKLEFAVKDTGHFQNFKPREIGTLQFSQPGVYTIRLSCLEKAAKAVMDVQQITLVRKSQATAPKAPKE